MATIRSERARSDLLPIRAAQEACSARLVHRPSLKVTARIGSGRASRRSCSDRDRSILLGGIAVRLLSLNLAPNHCVCSEKACFRCYLQSISSLLSSDRVPPSRNERSRSDLSIKDLCSDRIGNFRDLARIGSRSRHQATILKIEDRIVLGSCSLEEDRIGSHLCA